MVSAGLYTSSMDSPSPTFGTLTKKGSPLGDPRKARGIEAMREPDIAGIEGAAERPRLPPEALGAQAARAYFAGAGGGGGGAAW